MDVYPFEDKVIDTRRVDEVQRELDALPPTRNENDASTMHKVSHPHTRRK